MNRLLKLLKLFIFIFISNIIISCGSSDKNKDENNRIETSLNTSMAIFQIYAIQNGASDAPRISDYHTLGITKINHDNLSEANQLIAGVEKESILTPMDIQTLLYESGLFDNFLATPTPTPLSPPPTITHFSSFNEDKASVVFEYREIETKSKREITFALRGDHIMVLDINEKNRVDENSIYIDNDGYTLTTQGEWISSIDEDNLRKSIKTKDCKVDITKQGVYYCTHQLTWDRKRYEITRLIIVKDRWGRLPSQPTPISTPTLTPISTPTLTPISTPTPKLTLKDVKMDLAYNEYFTESQDEPVEAGKNYPDPGVAYYNKINGKRFYVINIVQYILEYAYEKYEGGKKIQDENGHFIPILDENGNHTLERDHEGRAKLIGYRSENQLSYNNRPNREYNATTRLAHDYNKDRVIFYEGEKDISSIFWNNFKVLGSASTGTIVTALREGRFTISYVISYRESDNYNSIYKEVLRVERTINLVDTSSPEITFPSNITFRSKNKKFTLSATETREVIYSLAGEDSKYFKIDQNREILQLSNLAVNGEYVIELIATEKSIPEGKEANTPSSQTIVISIDI